MSHLLSLSIGPVQDFIAAARKCRELWFGSWMLSEISKAAALAITQSEGDTSCLIFPAPKNRDELAPESSLAVANKILAKCGDPGKAAQAARAGAQRRLSELFEEAAKRLANLKGNLYDAAAARAQIEDLLEISWAAVPWSGDWAKDRRNAEALLASRKNTRDFAPVAWGASRPKSSLDGQREAVVDLGKLPASTAERLGARVGEILCAVSLLKRRGQRGEGRQFSTSHVAAQATLGKLTSEHESAVSNLILTLKDLGAGGDDLGNVPRGHKVFGRYDGRVLFEERLIDILPPSHVEQGRRALGSFFQATKLRPPKPYFAILVADGDRIGARIDAHRTDEESRQFTHKLARFAKEATKIVEEYDGWPIYVGGDDVLALLPVSQAINCGAKLDKAFRDLLPGTSLSAGIAVVHHLEFLGGSLDYARSLEKKAKDAGKRANTGAVCLGVSKRSGGEVEVVGTWDQAQTRLGEAIKLMKDDEVSHGLPYELRRLCDQVAEDSDDLLVHEARRIIERKQPRGTDQIETSVMEQLLERLQNRQSVTALSNDLIVAKELLANS